MSRPSMAIEADLRDRALIGAMMSVARRVTVIIDYIGSVQAESCITMYWRVAYLQFVDCAMAGEKV